MAKVKARPKLGRPVNKNSDETRQAILDVALISFANNGYRATSTRDIADRAGVTAGSIYHYFKNKHTLFLEIYNQVHESSIAAARELLQQSDQLTAGWADLAERFFDHHEQNVNIAKFNAVARHEAIRDPSIAEALYDNEWKALFQTVADKAVKNGEIAAKKAQVLASVLWTIMQGVSLHAAEASAKNHKHCLMGMVEFVEGTLIKPATHSQP